MDLAALKAELLAGHPDTLAYDADPVIAAAQGNLVNRTVNINSLSGDEIFAATDGTEFSALTDVKKQLWMAFCGRSSIDPFGASNVALVTWVFGGGSATVTALTALRTRAVSRFEELGFGRVRPGTITAALAS